jgi:hypothetical protein
MDALQDEGTRGPHHMCVGRCGGKVRTCYSARSFVISSRRRSSNLRLRCALTLPLLASEQPL